MFFDSDLFGEMEKADFIEREKRFVVMLPAIEFSKNKDLSLRLENEKVLVQGVIDCIFRAEDGNLVLLDYKTDSVYGMSEKDAADMLRKRHSVQLLYYKKAMEIIFAEKISKTLIYSFALGKTIEI